MFFIHRIVPFPKISTLLICLSFFILILAAAVDTKVPRLLLVSFDGFRWDYLSRNETKHSTPNFHRLMNEGVHARNGIKNAFITKTFPNHYTIVTGLYEESHGIVGNVMFDPVLNETFNIYNENQEKSSKWFDNGGEPIWVTNQLQNEFYHGNCRRTGVMFWPGDQAPVKGVLPFKYLPYDRTVEYKTRVDTIVRWFTDKYPVNLGLLYFEEPDHTGHQVGPDNPEINQKVIELDKTVGYLLNELDKKGILDDTDIIITSDHGMASTPQSKMINLDDYISPLDYRIFSSDPIGSVLPYPGKEDEMYQKLSNIPHLTVFKKADIPDDMHFKHNRRIQPLLLVTDEGYSLSHNKSKIGEGNHGYNNSFKDMHPFFIARGPSFKKGFSIDTFNNVDIYPLMCEILGINPAPNNGSLENVESLLVVKSAVHKSKSFLSYDSTFLIYIVLLVFIATVAGIFSIAACRQQRIHRHRRLRLSSLSPMAMQLKYSSSSVNGGKQPLLGGTDTDEEF
ncbi:ectonucleotide pyrophosphatase/phosphodiesterase family member 5-like [Mytilus trossulus]|uniref:ectonucleotide pyrophosphatase/phosphodiesterase family member 5-like n=1 Tax=Mytilus trossulus TaxID=6551 RepID=UPI0030050D3C